VSQQGLLLIGMIVVGVYVVGWTRRLAPAWSELPLKTTFAVGTAAVAVGMELSGTPLPAGLRSAIVVLVPLFVLAPLLITAAARARAYTLADLVTALAYWTEAGRDGVRRLTVQVALQNGDGDAALARLPEHDGEVMRAQAHAVRRDWDEVLRVDIPEGGDGASLGTLARIEALVALGRLREASGELVALRDRWERGGQGPLGYRSLVLGEAKIEAERGNLRRVRELLGEPLAGVAPDLLFGTVARSAEVAGEEATALRLYAEAYRTAPEGRRERYASPLREAGEELPTPLRRGVAGPATLTLAGFLALAFAGQQIVDATLGPYLVGGFRVSASQVASAFVLGLPIPDGAAWWRHLSYAFVHGGLIHVGFNLWVLLDIGRMLESRRGAADLLAAFAAGTAMGAVLTGMAQAGSTVVLVGASGGVLGVAGALLADVLRSRSSADRALLRGLVQWMALIALLSVAIPNVSLWGHVGGVVGGALWGFVRQGVGQSVRLELVAGAVAVVVLVVAFVQVVRIVLALA
jgi:membrane associated rhomboid family serine protease